VSALTTIFASVEVFDRSLPFIKRRTNLLLPAWRHHAEQSHLNACRFLSGNLPAVIFFASMLSSVSAIDT